MKTDTTEVTDAKIEESIQDSSTPVMSKRQKKKLIKLEQWEVKKHEKRLKERQKYKEKRANGEFVRKGPSRKALKRNKVDTTKSLISVAVDLSFEDLMNDKDVAKCVKQLLRVYTINRRSAHPMPLYFAGVQKESRTHKALEKNDGYQNWDVKFSEQSYLNIGFEKEKIVYLTAESDEVIHEFEEGNVYVIGGLVDHNQSKGVCHEKAVKSGIKTARLPLSEWVSMKTRTVLSIVHVFDILLRISDGQAWQSTLLEVLPSRKGALPKVTDNVEINTDNGDSNSLENGNEVAEDGDKYDKS